MLLVPLALSVGVWAVVRLPNPACVVEVAGQGGLAPGRVTVKTALGLPLDPITRRVYRLDAEQNVVGPHWSYVMHRWWRVPDGSERRARLETALTVCMLRRHPAVEHAGTVHFVTVD